MLSEYNVVGHLVGWYERMDKSERLQEKCGGQELLEGAGTSVLYIRKHKSNNNNSNRIRSSSPVLDVVLMIMAVVQSGSSVEEKIS